MRQPWLQATQPPTSVADDFSSRSAVMGLPGVLVVLALVWLILLMGRSEAIVDAAYGLPILPGTEAVIALAEWWNGVMSAVGLPELVRGIRSTLSVGR